MVQMEITNMDAVFYLVYAVEPQIEIAKQELRDATSDAGRRNAIRKLESFTKLKTACEQAMQEMDEAMKEILQIEISQG